MDASLKAAIQNKIEGFAKGARIAILCEGISESLIQMRPTPAVIQDIKTKIQSLNNFADYFGCDVKEQGKVVILSRQYRDKSEYLSVTHGELTRLLRNCLKIIGENLPDIKPQPERGLVPLEISIHRIIASLSRDQKQRLYSRAGLLTHDLSASQMRNVSDLLSYQYLHKLQQTVQQDLSSLQEMSNGVLVANTGLDPRTRFGLTVPSLVRRLSFRPITWEASEAGSLKNQIISPGVPTLADVIGWLNRVNSSSHPYQIEDDLGLKPVLAAGLDAAPPSQVVRGLCSLYNLTLTLDKSGSSSLGSRRAHRVTVEKVCDEIASILPSSIKQCLMRAEMSRKIPEALATRMLIPPSVETNANMLCSALAQRLYQGEISRARQGEREVKTPVSLLPEWERASLALVLCRRSLGVLGVRAQRVPPYISDPQSLRLSASSYSGRKGQRLSLSIGTYDSQDREWKGILWISDVDPPKP